MRFGARWLVAVGTLASCAHRAPTIDSDLLAEPERHPLAGYQAHFVLTWRGARIGDAVETLRVREDSPNLDDLDDLDIERLRFTRHERVIVRRGDTLVQAETAIVIDTDAALRAHRIELRQRTAGVLTRGVARRDARGDWEVLFDDEPRRAVPGDAVPAEIVPLVLALERDDRGARADASSHRDGAAGAANAAGDGPVFEGPVIMAGYGFATARLHVVARGSQALTATLITERGALRGDYELTQSGTVARVRAADGASAERVAASAIARSFVPPEIVESAAIPLEPAPSQTDDDDGDGAPVQALGAAGADAITLWIAPVSRPLPPPLPGQIVELGRDGWRVTLRAGDVVAPAMSGPSETDRAPASNPELAALADALTVHARTPRQEVFALVRATPEVLAGDLGAPATSARAALAAGRGDCTAHTALFAGLARARGISTRMVTGYRLDGDRLVRHRWAIVAVDGGWIAVDPTYGEAPARARLFGLATHGADAADMAITDDLAFAGLAAARAHLLAPAP